MPKYEVRPDLKERLADPIEFVLQGREFVVPVVPVTVIAALSRLSMDENDPGANILAMERVLEAVIGPEAFAELGTIDARELFPLVQWLAEVLRAGMGREEKNAPGA